ncbi:MAG: HAD-IB family phosphatase [Ilumatobacteraceae bacterium]
MTATPERPVVAAFDVDGTLTTRDCVVPFLRELVGTHRLVHSVLRRPGRSGRAAMRRDRDTFKAIAVATLAGRSMEENSGGRRFAREQERPVGCAPTPPVALAWHLESGHEVVLVSASLEAVPRSARGLLGVAASLCTRFEVDADGRLARTAAFGDSCRGMEKVRRLGLARSVGR